MKPDRLVSTVLRPGPQGGREFALERQFPTKHDSTRLWSPFIATLTLISALGSIAGCQQEMAAQPSYRPLVPSREFPNRMSARLLPEGVVAREWNRSDDPLNVGLKAEFIHEPPTADQTTKPTPNAPIDPSRFVDELPFKTTKADLKRGQERYTIYCALCHDPLGNGRGKIVERGYLKPPNFHSENSRGFERYGKSISLRDVPVGYIFEVISNGYGGMPRYGPQINELDRWRIVAYLKALQLSQHAVIEDLPERSRRAALDALGDHP